MKRIVSMVVGLMVFFGLAGVRGEGLRITSFESPGKLEFTEITNATRYQVEWAPSPDGPWTNTWAGLTDIWSQEGTGSITCSVPMFYRVAAETYDPPPMVEIPGGTNAGTDPDFGDYSLTVESFYMDETLVTYDQMIGVLSWAADKGLFDLATGKDVESSKTVALFNSTYVVDGVTNDLGMVKDGSSIRPPRQLNGSYPVTSVTIAGRMIYCNYLSLMVHRTPCYNTTDWTCDVSADGYRLPTYTEWEYAARGGLVGKRFPWGDTISHSNANYKTSTSVYEWDLESGVEDIMDPVYGAPWNFTRYTSPVKAFPPNGYGLYDMVGNQQDTVLDIDPNGIMTHFQFRGGAPTWGNRYSRIGAPFISDPLFRLEDELAHTDTVLLWYGEGSLRTVRRVP